MTPEIQTFIDWTAKKYASTRIEVHDSPAGKLMVDIFVDDKLFVLEYWPKDACCYGVTHVTEDTNPFTGADEVFSNWADALAYLEKMLAEQVNPAATSIAKSAIELSTQKTIPPRSSEKLPNPH